ncbi:MAG: threonine-phosphate decarboxylase CobD [Deltaproteobacteria bacterium]|nr:threonine-phosphate decarboxylase CobD [Deltaproteobacteria bacterium]
MDTVSRNDLQHHHGGRPERDFARLSVEPAPVVDFSVNLNPLGCPDLVRSRWSEMMEGIDRYPGLEGEGIARYLQERLDLPEENVLGSNGSTEMIYLIPRALGLQRVGIVSPCYHDYYRASVLAGAEVHRVRLSPDTEFRPLSADRLSAALSDADALWLGNPNNPTGTFFSRDVLSELAARFPRKRLIVDEAFMPFDEDWEKESLAVPPLLPNVLVIHSLTKFYGLAGLRLGGVTASAEVIERLRRFKEPWTVNSVSEALAPLLLECGDYDTETRRLVADERSRLHAALENVDGLTVFPSRANFLLCRWDKEPELDPLLRRLLACGICVRDCRNFPGLEAGYFRVAVRTPEDNDLLVEGLASLDRG